MKKEDKQVVIDQLTEKLKTCKNFYVSDISGLNSVDSQDLRRACFDANIKLMQVKNTLLKKAMENVGSDYAEIEAVLNGSSAIMFCESSKAPAALIKSFRKTHNKPEFKAAYVEECCYVGENQLEVLESIKSREEMIADIAAMLLSPMRNVISQINSAGANIAGVLKTIAEK